MCVARTARRRRRQAKLGVRGLEQIFGKRHCPHYPSPMTREKSAKLEARRRATEQRMKSKGKK